MLRNNLVIPTWVPLAKSFIGVSEIPGTRHSPIILKWLNYLNAWWNDDETPWCGVFIAFIFKTLGYPIPKLYMRAKSWLNWGKPVDNPVLGAVCIIDRKGGGHVFIVLGVTLSGNIVGIGGNQGNKVSIASFDKSRVLGYRVPKDLDISTLQPLDRISYLEISNNEA